MRLINQIKIINYLHVSGNTLKLNVKFAAVFLTASIALCVVTAEVASVVVSKSYETLEERHASSNFHVGENALREAFDKLVMLRYEYGEWDDAYDYVAGDGPPPMTPELLTETLIYSKAEFLAYFTLEGPKLILAADLNSEEPVEIGALVDLDAPVWSGIVSRFGGGFTMEGLVHSPSGLFMVTTGPVINSDGSGAYIGQILIGTRVDARFIKALQNKTDTKWMMTATGETGLVEYPPLDENDNLFAADTVVETEDGALVASSLDIVGENTIASAIYSSPDGQTTIEMTTITPRDIVAYGQASLKILMGFLALFMIITLFVLSAVLQKMFIKPIMSMSTIIETKDHDEGLEKLSLYDRKDEIGTLFRNYAGLNKENTSYMKKLKDAALKAEAASVSKSEFLANMSHEIRTPMNGVLGMAQVVQTTDLTEQQKMYVDTIYDSGVALLTIINDILDFSKIESGKMELDPVPFSPRSAMEGVLALLATQAQKKKIDLIAELDDVDTRHLIGDVGRIRQVATNLLGNAIKFTSDGFVLLRMLATDLPNGAVKVRVEIQDTGIGIPEDKLGLIFEEFTQAEGSTTRKFGGTGLGLSISSRIVEMMGGTIGVESNYGHGSTFWFEFDLETAEIPPQSLPDRCDLSGQIILVVDDLEVNRRILQNQLSSWGAKVYCVPSAEKALTVLRAVASQGRGGLPLVLTDYHMPHMDGLTFVENVRSDPAVAATKIITLSSVDDAESKAAFSALGVKAVISKPILSKDLVRALQTALMMSPGKQATVTNAPRLPSRIEAPAAVAKRPRLLVAEDNAVNRSVIECMFDPTLFDIAFAHNGQEAVDAVKVSKFDAILMDISMPEMSGTEATKMIRSMELRTGLVRTPIIALTAHAMEGDQERYMAAGMDDYCTKPIKQDELIAKVSAWTQKKSEGPSTRKAVA